MRTQLLVRLIVIVALLGGVTLALAFDGSAPTAKTGAPAIGGRPAEGTCADCHSDFALNVGGTVEIVGAPTYYTPGNIYTFSVRVTSSQTAGSTFALLWGFELTAVRMSDGTGAGVLANVPGEGTAVLSGSGQFSTRQYVRVDLGNQLGSASPVSWQVQWTAPVAGTGAVGFYASGMAADGDGTNNGDWIYTTSASAQDVTPTKNPTWGWIKQLYR